jgi:uncharacterized protein YecE (DUF72 family)
MAGGVYIGAAGWTIPRGSAADCPGEGSHLNRYARVLRGVEINSSFYRSHSAATYERWAESTPDDFRFAVKLPKLITHELRFLRSRKPLEQFLSGVSALGHRLGPILVQLPPSFAFDARLAARFFELFRERFSGVVVCEPRHATWFESRAAKLLTRFQVSRVAADPPVVPSSAEPGAWTATAYFRMHGSPRMYWSDYPDSVLIRLAARIQELSASRDVWCVFDNTATGSALKNAVQVQRLITPRG